MNPPIIVENKCNQHRFLIGLVIFFAILLAGASLVDREVTAALHRHQWKVFAEIMGRTLFEGQRPGANDPLVFLLLAALMTYLLGWLRPGSRRWSALRPQAGFILMTALVVAFLLVNMLKLSLGRARPDLVFNHGWPFSHWFTTGPHFIGDGLFRGAFPSGHTSQIFSSMAFAYALFCDPYASRRLRLLGLSWGVLIVCLSLLMGAARCMSLSHWLSDVIGAIGIGWIALHGIYFHLLHVPAQRIYFQSHGRHPRLPGFWELRLGGWLVLLALGVLVIVNGVRALLLWRALWLPFFIPMGLFLIVAATRKISGLRHLLVSQLGHG